MKLKSRTGIALAAAVGSIERQQSQDIVLDPILQATLERAQLGRASVLSISAAVPVRARSRSPSALALSGRCWLLTFQSRCLRAPPSGHAAAPPSSVMNSRRL